ncbi:COMP family protein [Megaselia abdita]
MRILRYFCCFLFLNLPVADLLTLDPAASSLLEHYIKNKDVIISLKHIRPRRKLSISTEALFVIDLPKIKHKISFFLNRVEHLVTMDISSNSLTVSKSFLLPYNNESSTIRSLAIAFHGKQISLYIECNEVSVHSVEKGLSQLYLQSDTPSIKLFRERKYPLYFDGSIDDALSRGNCHRVRKNGNKKLLKNKTHNKGKIKTHKTVISF